MRPILLATAVTIVGITVVGCGSRATVSAPVTIPVTAASTTAARATASVDTTVADVAAITALWRSHNNAGRSGGWRAFYQDLAETAYPEGAWNLESITCYDRLIQDRRVGRHLTVEQYLTALNTQGPPPEQMVDPARIEPSPGWVLGSADATVGGGKVPSGGIYVMTLRQTPDHPPTTQTRAHATVIAGTAYWFPFSCVDAQRSP